MSTTISPTSPPQPIDEGRLEQATGRLVGELGAALGVALVAIGDRLGLYRAMAGGRPVSPAELAAATGTHERYVREWLAAQAAGGIVVHHAGSDQFHLDPEHAFLLADEDSPLALAGFFEAAGAAIDARGQVADAFRSGAGVAWHDHDAHLFCGVERAFGAVYRSQLVQAWLPALDGIAERLAAGGSVLDVGCGHGISTILMAQAYPAARLVGVDYHAASIDVARERAAQAGVADRLEFRAATAQQDPGAEKYDLVCFFDALHDMGDPVGAARSARAALAPGGSCLVVEPFAGDRLEDNLNPVGRLFYGFSTLVCTPGSLSQPGRAGLGTQAGEAKLREVLLAGGFGSVRRAAETPFNLVLEARA